MRFRFIYLNFWTECCLCELVPSDVRGPGTAEQKQESEKYYFKDKWVVFSALFLVSITSVMNAVSYTVLSWRRILPHQEVFLFKADLITLQLKSHALLQSCHCWCIPTASQPFWIINMLFALSGALTSFSPKFHPRQQHTLLENTSNLYIFHIFYIIACLQTV